MVFDTSGPVEHTVFTLKEPDRLVVDIDTGDLAAELPQPSADDRILTAIRSGKRGDEGIRVVLDLKRPVAPRTLVLKPNERYGHRLVLDLYDPEQRPAEPVLRAPADASAHRALVIAVDAGHGGDDPGAIGRAGTHEKDVVLAIARRLATLIDREPSMRAVLIRDGDYYIPLRERFEKARLQRADLFVSIHADAVNHGGAHGASVYTLSRRGASSEFARRLAEGENAADLVGGVTLDDKDDMLRSVLLDLSQTATTEASQKAADFVLSELGGVGSLHKSSVQRAGFVVLKSPDIPSMLVETAFISNRSDERHLNDPRHQDRLASAIFAGVRRYFTANPVPGTLAMGREHRVVAGDTLSTIARRYQVSVDALRSANGLNGDRLLAGQTLAIP